MVEVGDRVCVESEKVGAATRSGVVNDVDLTAWQDGYGMAENAEPEHGDADGDGSVDGSDFLTWQRTLGATSTAAAAAWRRR